MDNLEEALKVGNAIRKLLQSWWGGWGVSLQKGQRRKECEGKQYMNEQ